MGSGRRGRGGGGRGDGGGRRNVGRRQGLGRIISGRFFHSSPPSPLRWNRGGGGTQLEVVRGLASGQETGDGIEGLHEQNVQAVGEEGVRHFEDALEVGGRVVLVGGRGEGVKHGIDVHINRVGKGIVCATWRTRLCNVHTVVTQSYMFIHRV